VTGGPSADKLIMVTSRYPLATTTKTRCAWEGGDDPNSSIKDGKLHRELRRQGDSKEKAARISNAAAARGRSSVGKPGGDSGY
jgi:hypothetical protein